jgi:hypothetical protein
VDEPRQKSDLLASLALTCGRFFVHTVVVLLVFLVLSNAVLTFHRFFAQESAMIPQNTARLMSLSLWMTNHYPLAVPAILFLDGCVLLSLQLLRRPWRFFARLWFGAVLTAAVFLLTFAIVFLAVPFDALLPPESQVLLPEQSAVEE